MAEAENASILVVDDDVDTCHNLSDILTDLGYRVDTAYDGPAALDLVRAKPYDIVLLDYKMPGMDGLTAYREIRKIRSGTVAVIVTAYSGTTAEAAQDAGVWHVLPKPVDLSFLLNLLNQALGQPLVMVVDDDPDLCKNLWDLLRDQGYRVCIAHNEEQATTLLRERPYRAVLIDMKLSNLGGGEEVYRLVRTTNPEAHVVLITGHRDEMNTAVEKLATEGVDAVCFKPFDVPKLLETLKRVTE